MGFLSGVLASAAIICCLRGLLFCKMAFDTGDDSLSNKGIKWSGIGLLIILLIIICF